MRFLGASLGQLLVQLGLAFLRCGDFTGFGIGFPYAAVFNGAAASARTSPASAQAVVGWGGTLTAIFGPPLVGTLLDATGDFAVGFLALGAIVVAVLALTALIHPIDLAVGDRAIADASGPSPL